MGPSKTGLETVLSQKEGRTPGEGWEQEALAECAGSSRIFQMALKDTRAGRKALEFPGGGLLKVPGLPLSREEGPDHWKHRDPAFERPT